jgi:hypothetical protein
MADWVWNRVAVEGPEKDVTAFFAFDAGSTPLLHHLSAPAEDDLPITATVFDDPQIPDIERFSRAAEHVGLVLGTERAIDLVAEASGRVGWNPYLAAVVPDELTNPFDLLVKRGDFKEFPAEEQNIARYGVPDGSSWRRLAWGSTRPECELQCDGATLRFRSAWSGLLRGYRNLSHMFPSLVFRYLWYSDEVSDDIVIGYEVLQAGRVAVSQDGSARRVDLVPDYETMLGHDGDAALEEMKTALENFADGWWGRLQQEPRQSGERGG